MHPAFPTLQVADEHLDGPTSFVGSLTSGLSAIFNHHEVEITLQQSPLTECTLGKDGAVAAGDRETISSCAATKTSRSTLSTSPSS
jgi:hypothetical protein